MTQAGAVDSVAVPDVPMDEPWWRRMDAGPAYLLLVALLATVAGWIPGRTIVPSATSHDPRRQEIATTDVPWAVFAGHAWGKGNVPVWNPHQGLGVPLVGDNETGIFHPLTFVHAVLPERAAWVVIATIKLWLAGAGAYWLARRTGVSAVASLAAGGAYMLAGVNVAFLLQAESNTMALLPLTLLAAMRLMDRPTAWRMLGLTLLMTIGWAGGKIEAGVALAVLVVIGALLHVMLTLVRAGEEDVSVWNLVGGALLTVAAAAVGFAVTGAQWVTMADQVETWGAAAYPFQTMHTVRERLAHLGGTLFPYMFGPARLSWGAGWAGTVTLALAIAGMVLAPGRRTIPWIALLGASVLLAIAPGMDRVVWNMTGGEFDNVTGQIIKHGLNISHSAMFMAGVGLSLSVLAACGVEWLASTPAGEPRLNGKLVLLGAAGVGVLALAIGVPMLLSKRLLPMEAGFWLLMPAVAVAAAGTLLVQRTNTASPLNTLGAAPWVAVIALEGLIFCIGVNRGSWAEDGSAGAIAWLRTEHARLRLMNEPARVLVSGTLPPNLASKYGLSDPREHGGILWERQRKGMAGLGGDVHAPALATLGVRHLLLPATADPPGGEWKQVYYDQPSDEKSRRTGMRIYERAAQPRAWIAKTGRSVGDASAALAQLSAPDPKAAAALDAGMPGESSMGGRSYAPPVTGAPQVEWVKDAPGRIHLRITGGGGGMLVLADAHAPGWTAKSIRMIRGTNRRGLPTGERRDETEVAIQPAFGLLRAAAVPTGSSSLDESPRRPRGGRLSVDPSASSSANAPELVFEYSPRGWQKGTLISLAGGLVLAILFGWSLVPAGLPRSARPAGRSPVV